MARLLVGALVMAVVAGASGQQECVRVDANGVETCPCEYVERRECLVVRNKDVAGGWLCERRPCGRALRCECGGSLMCKLNGVERLECVEGGALEEGAEQCMCRLVQDGQSRSAMLMDMEEPEVVQEEVGRCTVSAAHMRGNAHILSEHFGALCASGQYHFGTEYYNNVASFTSGQAVAAALAHTGEKGKGVRGQAVNPGGGWLSAFAGSCIAAEFNVKFDAQRLSPLTGRRRRAAAAQPRGEEGEEEADEEEDGEGEEDVVALADMVFAPCALFPRGSPFVGQTVAQLMATVDGQAGSPQLPSYFFDAMEEACLAVNLNYGGDACDRDLGCLRAPSRNGYY